jgi:glucose-6-phosphate isomerase
MLTSLSQWQALESHFDDVKNLHMRDLFSSDNGRFSKFSLNACGITLDYSKNRITEETLSKLAALAEAVDVETKRDAMFSGAVINATEGRAVLHTALRNFSGEAVFVDDQDVMPEVTATLSKIKHFVGKIHSGESKGFTGKAFTDVVAIGIGGSFLGPKIMTEALKPYRQKGLKVHFVANVDGCHIHDVLAELDAETTLVVMSSKSFTTQETQRNTLTAKDWFLNTANQDDVAKHFMCVSSNIEAATEFGIAEENIFPMWDWVGGRYSLWSAIGLPIALSLGYDNFERLLKGAFDMDQHFKTAPLDQNMPVIMALLGVWYRNFFGAQSHVLLPYYHYLRGLPAYVQQLDMESNGKSVTSENQFADYDTGPIIWGSEGTNGQHSFHQLIHQGNTLIPADFIFPLHPEVEQANHHAMLASNCFGQTQALMQGMTLEEVKSDLVAKGLAEKDIADLAPHKVMPGNKPSNTLIFEKLTPETLGSLISLYEHKVFVQGVIWDLNSFDQWGVELGKVLGNNVLSKLENPSASLDLDDSTNNLISLFRDR